jgi:hypothetical protein
VRQVGGRDESQNGNGSDRKRKRCPVDPEEPNTRSRPRPRLQDTHRLSDLQKISQDPSTYRKSIKDTCKLYGLELQRLMYEVSHNAYLMNLPIFVDEYTEIDTWDSLRTHLHSTAHRPGAEMQRIRAKAATRNHVAQNDPVLYVGSGKEIVRTTKLHGEHQSY